MAPSPLIRKDDMANKEVLISSAKVIESPRKIDRHSIDRDEQRKKLRYQRDKDRELVKGIFRFYEVPGGSMSFSIKLYKEDQVENYDLVDGAVYTLPLGVARHLNKNGWYPIYGHIIGEGGVQQGFAPGIRMQVAKKVRRFGFQSLEFMDHEDLMYTKEPIITSL